MADDFASFAHQVNMRHLLPHTSLLASCHRGSARTFSRGIGYTKPQAELSRCRFATISKAMPQIIGSYIGAMA